MKEKTFDQVTKKDLMQRLYDIACLADEIRTTQKLNSKVKSLVNQIIERSDIHEEFNRK